MAKTSLKIKQQKKPKYSTRAYTRCNGLRKTTFCTQKVRHLPYLLQRNGVQG